MPKQTLIEVAAGAAFTDVPATIAAHYVRIYENGDRSHAFEYQLPGDDYATTYTTQDGGDINSDIIKLIGHGWSGILAHGPDYAYDGQDASLYMKIREKGGNPVTIVLYESENGQEHL